MKRCDLIFRQAELYDGTGSGPVIGDLAVQGDRIAGVGDLSGWTASRERIVEGLALAPGFIDAHAHDDRQLLCEPAHMTCKLSQGVTTVIIGNCGISLSPVRFGKRPPPPLDLLGDESWWKFGSFAEYRERLRQQPPPVNALALIGHMTLRLEALRMDTERAATDLEAARMHDRLRDALSEGAAGLSTGLWYPPSRAAPTQEVLAVAEALRPTGGLYVTHLRDEGNLVVESLQEGLDIGRKIGCPVIISHHKCTAPENFGKSVATLALIDVAARAQSVGLDAYPYAAGATALLPDVVREDIPTKISWSVPYPELTGRMLSEISAAWGCDQRSAARRLTPAGAIYFSIDEGDVRRILAHPRTVIGSDGLPHDTQPHPRLWGTFPRVLGHYSRDLGLFDMATAIHKMTGRTAALFGIPDRGELRPGAFADLVLFDASTVRDRSTFENPALPSEGILECWVNGHSAYRSGDGVIGPSSGRLLTRVP